VYHSIHHMNATFDLDDALHRVGGDRELLREVAGMFVEDAPGMLGAVERALKERDPAEVFRAAHRIKGPMANFSARDAVAAALRLERMGAEESFAGADEALRVLREEVGRLRAELRAFASEIRNLDVPASGQI
jgi:histidine phosphotransfer protein HptB